ncbi:MAG: ABC transporter permease [Candidatus Limnocylindrales bacterium]|jgi:ribose transport system permease protein
MVRFQSILGLVIVFVAAVIVSPRVNGQLIFLEPRNLGNIIQDISEYGILAVGMTFVIISGGIDLSVGRALGLATVVIGRLMMVSGWDAIPAVLGTLAVGLIFGMVQGAVLVRFKLQAFIVTLAGMWIAYGLALSLLPNGQFIGITFGNGPNHAPTIFQHLADRFMGVVPVAALIFLGVGLLGLIILNFTRFGRQVYAIGGNERAARLSGIPVARVRIIVFGIAGLMAALAGIVDAGQFNFGNPAEGFGYELWAIACVVIGGTSLFGGRGSMVGTLAGVLMLGCINNILLLCNIDNNVHTIVTGLIVVVAAALQTVVGGFSSSVEADQPTRPAGLEPAQPGQEVPKSV